MDKTRLTDMDTCNKESQEEFRQRVIETSNSRGEFVTDVDGFVYWWPQGSPNGHLNSCHLRWLADELDRRNKDWEESINSFFASASAERGQ